MHRQGDFSYLFRSAARHPQSLQLGQRLAKQAQRHLRANGYDSHVHGNIVQFQDEFPDEQQLAHHVPAAVDQSAGANGCR